ncbi:MAG: glycosyltransferase, partial [Candidatus Kapabacteria bacterium]|nr:glycosyltransferase [Candidatus Kapabacteria bacterium]
MTYNSISPYVGSIPFFSVILCTYNRATLIHRAIDSLLHQTESDWELLIVDDGSND